MANKKDDSNGELFDLLNTIHNNPALPKQKRKPRLFKANKTQHNLTEQENKLLTDMANQDYKPIEQWMIDLSNDLKKQRRHNQMKHRSKQAQNDMYFVCWRDWKTQNIVNDPHGLLCLACARMLSRKYRYRKGIHIQRQDAISFCLCAYCGGINQDEALVLAYWKQRRKRQIAERFGLHESELD